MNRSLCLANALALLVVALGGCLGGEDAARPTLEATTSAGVALPEDVAAHAAFDAWPARPDDGAPVRLVDRSGGSREGDGFVRQWSFGDGHAARGAIVEHVFATGTWTVCLALVDGAEAMATGCRELVVANAVPVAAFELSAAPHRAGEAIVATSRAQDPSLGGRITEQTWYLDGVMAGTGPTVALVPPPGDHVLRLVVQDDAGAVAAHDRALQVNASRPVARLVVESANVAEGEPVEVRDLSWSERGDGQVLKRAWYVPAGEEVSIGGDSSSVRITFGRTGAHVVCVEVWDGWGGRDRTCSVVHVENRPPVAGIAWSPADPLPREPVTFTSLATDPSPRGEIVALTWAIDDVIVSTNATFTHTFATKGEHVVALRAVDDEGASTTAVRIVEVANRPPVLTMPATVHVIANRSVSIDLVATDPDGDPLTLALQDAPAAAFLDAANATVQWRPTPAEVGLHRIAVEVSDGTHEATAHSWVEVVYNRAPVVLVDVDPVVEAGRDVVLTSGASFDPEGTTLGSVRWWWNNTELRGDVIDGPNATFVFPVAGRYTVWTEAIDADGIRALVNRTVLADDSLHAHAALQDAEGLHARGVLVVEVVDDRGEPVPNATVFYDVEHELRRLRLDSGVLTTDRWGRAATELRPDTCIGTHANLVGPHRVAVWAAAPSREGAVLNDTEWAYTEVRYHVGPARDELALASTTSNLVPRDPFFGGIERGAPNGLCEVVGIVS